MKNISSLSFLLQILFFLFSKANNIVFSKDNRINQFIRAKNEIREYLNLGCKLLSDF